MQSAEAGVLEGVPPEVVRQAARALPDEDRVALYLADMEGLSYRQAALVLDWPAGAVAAAVRRARARLRALLLLHATAGSHVA